MRNLYVKVWLALVTAVFVSLIGGAITARAIAPEQGPVEPALRAYAVGLTRDLPAGRDAIEARLRELAVRHEVSLTLYDGDQLVASSSEPLPPPRRDEDDHWVRSIDGAGMAVRLPDGRWLIIGHKHPGVWVLVRHLAPVLGVVFAILAAAAWPIARMVTRRLEELRGAVEELGQGDLSARVPVRGADEVAELARSFNASAGRIETLVDGQRRVLASASHELRSPLARIRIAAELAEGEQEFLDEIDRNVVELDALIDDILLASRLDAGAAPAGTDEIDLGVLARQEAERVGASVSGDGVAIGDERMARRMLRNLLENAKKHGAEPISVDVGDGQLVVSDSGEGIPADERERVFEPFYRPQGHRESDGGVGLGLALVKRIADHHGATVTIGDSPTGGARVAVTWGRSVQVRDRA